jgi:hypothetical protein
LRFGAKLPFVAEISGFLHEITKQAASNTEAVASATKELTASVSEVARQVQVSKQIFYGDLSLYLGGSGVPWQLIDLRGDNGPWDITPRYCRLCAKGPGDQV